MMAPTRLWRGLARRGAGDLAARLLSVAVCGAVGSCLFAGSALAAASFRVGVAAVSINPTVTTYSGGFAASPPITPGHVVGPPLSVRALYVSNGHSAIELAVVDSQAEFAAYQEGSQYGITAARDSAAQAINAAHDGPSIGPQDIILQATHSHSAPTLEGLWGPVPVAYLQQVTQAEQHALVEAAANAQPAVLRFGTADGSSLDNVVTAQYDSFPGWADDPLLSVLWALNPKTGATIATYATVPAHPDIVCGQCLGELTADYDGLVRTQLQQQLGGTSLVGPGTLGREETPIQATGIMEDHVMATQIANLVDGALASARPITSNVLSGTQQMIDIPGTGAVLLGLVAANQLPDAQKQQIEQASGEYPVDRADTPPYQTGSVIGTWVTALRLGNIAYLSMPGEPFPEIRQTLASATKGATVVALSKGQDDLGYFYPSYISPFAEIYPSDTLINSGSAETGDVVLQAQDQDLRTLGFDTSPTLAKPVSVDAGQAVEPGLQVVGGPFVTDAGAGGRATVELLPVFSPPDLPEGTLEYGLPEGSVPAGDAPTGPVRWNFGDGVTTTSGYHNFAGSDLKPLTTTPTFTVGTHHITGSILDASGQVATTNLVITIFPRLRVSISKIRHGRTVTLRARVSGGDGRLLAIRWRFGSRAAAAGRVVRHLANGARVQLTVTDGTGSSASVRTRLPRA